MSEFHGDANETIEHALRRENPWAAVELAKARIRELEEMNTQLAEARDFHQLWGALCEYQRRSRELDADNARLRGLLQRIRSEGTLNGHVLIDEIDAVLAEGEQHE